MNTLFTHFIEEIHAPWSDATFGSPEIRGPIGPLKHLQKEVAEVLANPTDLVEYADCLLLLMDAARRAGFSVDQLTNAAFKKHAENVNRIWDRPLPDEPVEHKRSPEGTDKGATMRELTDHKSSALNNIISVQALGDPGAGGAHSLYRIEGWGDLKTCSVTLTFQNGGMYEVGPNGLSDESLISVLIDRLRGFQKGPFSCRENAIALTHLEESLMWLQKRTSDRIARNVEGKNQK